MRVNQVYSVSCWKTTAPKVPPDLDTLLELSYQGGNLFHVLKASLPETDHRLPSCNTVFNQFGVGSKNNKYGQR